MCSKRRDKLVLATFTIIVLVSLFLVIIGYFFVKNSDLKSLMYNLSTELFGYTVLYIIVKRIFLSEEWKLLPRIKRLLVKLENGNVESDKFFFRRAEKIDLGDSNNIDLCGVTLTSTIHEHLLSLCDVVNNNGVIRILIIDQKSIAPRSVEERSDTKDIDITDYYTSRIDSTYKDIEYINSEWKEKHRKHNFEQNPHLQVRLLSYPPSFGIIKYFDQASLSNKIVVEIYPHKKKEMDRPIFVLDEANDEFWYEYFLNQYNVMWDHAKPLDLSKNIAGS